MRVSFISIIPEMILQHLEYGVIGRAVNQGAIDLQIYNPRDYANDVNIEYKFIFSLLFLHIF